MIPPALCSWAIIAELVPDILAAPIGRCSIVESPRNHIDHVVITIEAETSHGYPEVVILVKRAALVTCVAEGRLNLAGDAVAVWHFCFLSDEGFSCALDYIAR